MSDLKLEKDSGLSSKEVAVALREYGQNIISVPKKKSKFITFIKNFNSPLIYILFSVALITLFLGKTLDSMVILFVTLVNAVIGYLQEEKAENALEALKKMTQLHAVVMRDGQKQKITSNLIVPGDIIILEEGDKVPADGVIMRCNNLQIDEAVLTGESFPVEKGISDALYMSTTVSSGNAVIRVTKTGKETEFGKISKLVEDELNSMTPLQKKMAVFSKKLGFLVIAICVSVFVIGVAFGQSALVMFETSIALAVSAIPEGLPVAITVVLVLGVKRMAKKKAIIRNMNAVETLGTTTVIATDKTGTLTHNKLTVIEVFTDLSYGVSGDGYGLKGYFHKDKNKIDPKQHLRLLLTAGVLANNGEIREKNGKTEIFGDPTDCAVLVAAHKGGIDKEAIYESIARLDEIPFSSENKYSAVLVDEGGVRMTYLKGAPEEVIKRCQYLYSPEEHKLKKMTTAEVQKLNRVVSEMTSKGLRVISLAYKEDGYSKEKLEAGDVAKGFIFVGLLGMRDTFRLGIKESIRKCQEAGIRVVMLTGDHIETASIIGQELGIMKDKTEAIIAHKIESMDPKEVREIVKTVSIYARISPEAKYRIIEALKANGEIVAMTGDGVNDVPALKKADIGVAMGVMGTEAAKDASDMILTDDNFTTIVTAVDEGRTVFENIRKTIFYLLSTSLGEVITVIGGIVSGFGLVLLPLQILWINMVTDTAVTIPLGMEPGEEDHTLSPPRNPKEGIVNRLMILRILLVSTTMAIVALTAYKNSLWGGKEYANTMIFSVLVVIQWFNSLNAKSEKQSILRTKIFANKALLVGVGLAITGQLVILYTPVFQNVFGLVGLGTTDWLMVVAYASSVIFVIETQKFITYLYKLVYRKK